MQLFIFWSMLNNLLKQFAYGNKKHQNTECGSERDFARQFIYLLQGRHAVFPAKT